VLAVSRGGAVAGEAAAVAGEDFRGFHRGGLCAGATGATTAVVISADRLLDALSLALPPRCPGCGEIVRGDHRFCPRCWGSLRFLGPPCCSGCGAPFDVDADTPCDGCRARPPIHAGIHAAVAYGEVARAVALGLKYGGRTSLARTAAGLMRRGMPPGDVLVPVPLHRWRLWSRGYNQAALIADALARFSGLPVERRTLRRIRATAALRGLGRHERAREVRAAFDVDPRRAASLAGKRVVLIDDVYTSGATTEACVRVLLGAGAASVAVACWARVLDDAVD
jgi:ComF family protein